MNSLRQNPIQKFMWPTAVVLLTLLIAALIFKIYLIHPNQHIYAFGGDPWVIYFDVLFHTRYDHGAMLGAMNYPHGEYIFLTDAQGSLASVMQWINHHLFPISAQVPGIIHSLNIYLLPVCSLMLFYILVYYNVQKWLALLFAVLITFMAPATMRIGNHFGLAYPFVIPMAILWFLRKYKKGKLEWRDLLVSGILIFYTLNNPYIGFGACALLLCMGGFLFLLGIKKHEQLKKGIIVGGVGLVSTLIPFLILHFNDPFHDRLERQWGFFAYNANLGGLFIPPHSLLHQCATWLKLTIRQSNPESLLNVGMVSTLLLLAIIILAILGIKRKKIWDEWSVFSTENKVLMGGAFILFLLAANKSLFDLKHWMENHMGPLLMFKASARLGWSIYFAITISGVLFLDQVLRKIKSPVIVASIVLIMASTWSYEIKTYGVDQHYKEIFNSNFFAKNYEDEMLNILHQNQIDIAQFQAMLVLPKMMGWNDDFDSEINWASQFFSMRLSTATGIPMINAMLSRISVGQCAEAIQMLANPVIHRDLIPKLPNQKNLLLLVGGGHSTLREGEQFLIDISKPLYQSKDFSLYALSLDSIQNNPYIRNAREIYQQHLPLSNDVIHLSFDDDDANSAFYGKGAKLIHPGQTLLVDQILPCTTDTNYVFSSWSTIDYHQAGIAEWHLIIEDSLGQDIRELNSETKKNNDIQDLWFRSELTFHAPKGSRIKASVLSEKNLYVDEVIIYPVHSTTIIDLPESKQFLYNGYKVQKLPY